MAYTITLTDAITSDRVTATITDATVYSSPIRSAVRVFMSANKQAADNTVSNALTLTPNNTDSEIVTSWSWFYSETDGWYIYYFAILKAAYAGGTTYNIYDAVYDSTTDLVYRSLANSNVGNALSNTTWWQLITSPSTLAANKGESNESLNIESTVYQRVLTYNSQYEYGNFVSEACANCCGDCESDEADATYNLLSLLLNGAVQADLRTECVKGETICRRLSGIFENC